MLQDGGVAGCRMGVWQVGTADGVRGVVRPIGCCVGVWSGSKMKVWH